MRQTRQAASRLELDSATTSRLMLQVESLIQQLPSDVSPPVKASKVHACIRHVTANSDPYLAAKQQATRHALSLLPYLRGLVESSSAPFDTALRLALAGNIIDLGVAESYDLEASIARVQHAPFDIDHSDALRHALAQSASVLYLLDNAGETLFDRLFIEQLRIPVTVVAKGGPAVNDATLADALEVGLDQVATLIDQGAATLGTLLDECSPEFVRQFTEAPLVIAKGMANFESLQGSRGGIYFLLQAKCAVIARHLGVAEKGLIVLAGEAEQAK